MSSRAMFQTLAAYNQWMNGKLYAVAANMTDDARKTDVGAFFKSLHGTLNHLLWADMTWLNRLADETYVLPPLGTPVYDDFHTLEVKRRDIDQRIIQWVDSLSDAWLAQEMTWRAKADNIERRQPRWLLVLHMFNHQTHHRGQATTLLTQAGLDVGVTDLPRM